MSLKPLRIRNKVLEVPIIQGGMGVGLSWERLAGAVAREGAMGLFLRWAQVIGSRSLSKGISLGVP